MSKCNSISVKGIVLFIFNAYVWNACDCDNARDKMLLQLFQHDSAEGRRLSCYRCQMSFRHSFSVCGKYSIFWTCACSNAHYQPQTNPTECAVLLLVAVLAPSDCRPQQLKRKLCLIAGQFLDSSGVCFDKLDAVSDARLVKVTPSPTSASPLACVSMVQSIP